MFALTKKLRYLQSHTYRPCDCHRSVVREGAHRVLYFWHYIGNRFLTSLSNLLTNLNLTDMETAATKY